MVNDGRPTDAAVLAEVRKLISDFTERHTALHGRPPRWAPGHSEDEIAAIERRLGVRLPEDLRALYRTIRDDGAESGLLGRLSPTSLDTMVEWHADTGPITFPADIGLFADEPVVFETDPPGHVQRVAGNDRWLTFASDHAMNFAAVDLDPAEQGRYGQIVKHGRDVGEAVEYLAPSITHILYAVLAAPLDADEWVTPGIWATPGHRWLTDLGEASPADAVAALPNPSTIQSAHLRRADRVRLADLAGLPNLRSIRVYDVRRQAQYIDLTLPTGLPIEHVKATAAQFEPEQLAGAPHLSYLTLAGNPDPVPIAALASVPNLLRLDLARAAVTDIAALTDFPALRVLTLDFEQWQTLLGSGWTPDGLAAVALGGSPAPAEAETWRATIEATA